MTGMPTGEVEVDSAEGAEAAEAADGTGDADACWATTVEDSLGGSVSVEAWSRSPAGGGEPDAASVMRPILGGEPGRSLLRWKEPRGIRGRSSREGAYYSLAWFLGMPLSALILSRVNAFLAALNTSQANEVASVVSNAVPCLVVGVIFLMSAALWNEAVMGVLGGWILLVTLVVTIVGMPWAWWIMSVAGGGGIRPAEQDLLRAQFCHLPGAEPRGPAGLRAIRAQHARPARRLRSVGVVSIRGFN